MKFRKLLVVGGISLLPVFGYAQEIAFDKSDKVFQLGVGMGYGGLYGSSTLPAISGTFEMGYNDNISLGGFAAYASSEDTWEYYDDNEYGFEYNYIGLGVRGAYHYGLFDSKKIDTYAGMALGYNLVSVSTVGFDDASAEGSFLLYGGFMGLRYFFKPNFGVYTELGYGGLGNATVGLSLKF